MVVRYSETIRISNMMNILTIFLSLLANPSAVLDAKKF